MVDKALSVSDPIEARCTKCRDITNHIIVAMVEEKPARVKCNTCGGEHNYRKPRATVAAGTRKPSTRAKADPRDAERKEWETLRPDMDSSRAVAYSMDVQVKVNNLINHPTFGLGLVQLVVGDRKVEVLFEDGKKVMRCG